jgi:hypothetical protein
MEQMDKKNTDMCLTLILTFYLQKINTKRICNKSFSAQYTTFNNYKHLALDIYSVTLHISGTLYF